MYTIGELAVQAGVTVETTIAYLKRGTTMDTSKLFSGFSPEEEEYCTAEAEKLYDPATVKESSRRWKAYGPLRQKEILEEGKAIYLGTASAMSSGPGSPEVQRLIGLWRQHMSHFWTPSKDQMVPLAENYAADVRFRQNFDAIQPGLAEFMVEAVRAYVKSIG